MEQSAEAFRKYRKERRQLGSLFDKQEESQQQVLPMLISPAADIDSGLPSSRPRFPLTSPVLLSSEQPSASLTPSRELHHEKSPSTGSSPSTGPPRKKTRVDKKELKRALATLKE